MTFADILRHHAVHPATADRPALVFRDEAWTYRDLSRRANRLTRALRALGVAQRQQVALLLPNRPELFEIFAAACRLGAAIVPVGIRLTAREVAYMVNHAEARVLVFDSQVQDVVQSLRAHLPSVLPGGYVTLGRPPAWAASYETLLAGQPDGDLDAAVPDTQTCWLPFTGGTTGPPKAGCIPHRHLLLNLFANVLQFGWRPDDVHLANGSLAHGFAFTSALAQLLIGGRVIVLERFSPQQTLEAVERERVTWLAMVPTMFQDLLSAREVEGAETRSLRMFLTAGAAMSVRLKRDLIARFPHMQLFEYYGATETGWVTLLPPEDQLRKAGSVGRPMLGVEVRILGEDGEVLPQGSVGEIFKRGMPYVEAFFKNPEADAAIRRGEWVTAGDVGYLDPEGYLTLVDRKRDLIITGGLNVYPSEVEAVVAEHPAVRECAVVGVPDDRWGEAVHAVVVLQDRPPAEPAGEAAAQEALLVHCRRNLAGYKCPKRFNFVTELPKSHVGKVLRRRLRDELLAGMGAETPVEGR